MLLFRHHFNHLLKSSFKYVSALKAYFKVFNRDICKYLNILLCCVYYK